MACAAHAGVASLAECRALCEWFDVERHQPTIHHWHQKYAEYHDPNFISDPVAQRSMKNRFNSKMKESVAVCCDRYYAKFILHIQISRYRGRDPAKQFLSELKEKHRVSDTEVVVNDVGYFTVLARTDLNGGLNYSD